MSRTTFPLIKPGAPAEVHNAVRHDPDKADGEGVDSTDVLLIATTVASALAVVIMSTDVGLVIFTILLVILCCDVLAYGAFLLWSRRGRRLHDRHVAQGNIVYVDKHLLHVWDELRAEHNVHLTDEERSEHVHDLFDAAVDLQAELEAWANTENNDNPGDRQLLAEARIRARLLPHVTILKEQQDLRRQFDALGSADPAGTRSEDVQEQLRILRARRATAAAQPQHLPAADTGGAP